MNYFPFHIGDYAAHTAHLEPLEDLAYRRLIDLYYLRESALPADVDTVARLIRMRSNTAEVSLVLNEFFELTSIGWEHERCEAEISKMQDKQTKAKASAHASVLARSANAQQTLSERSAKVELPTPTPTPTPTPIKEKELTKVSFKKTGSRISDDFVPSEESHEFCASQRPDLIFTDTLEGFRDYWKSAAGAKGLKLDWNATFRNWVRNQRPQNRQGAPQAMSFQERAAAKAKADMDFLKQRDRELSERIDRPGRAAIEQ